MYTSLFQSLFQNKIYKTAPGAGSGVERLPQISAGVRLGAAAGWVSVPRYCKWSPLSNPAVPKWQALPGSSFLQALALLLPNTRLQSKPGITMVRMSRLWTLYPNLNPKR